MTLNHIALPPSSLPIVPMEPCDVRREICAPPPCNFPGDPTPIVHQTRKVTVAWVAMVMQMKPQSDEAVIVLIGMFESTVALFIKQTPYHTSHFVTSPLSHWDKPLPSPSSLRPSICHGKDNNVVLFSDAPLLTNPFKVRAPC